MSIRDWVGKPNTGRFEFGEHLRGVDVGAMRERFLERLAGIRGRMIVGGWRMPETPEEHEEVRLRIEQGLAEFRERMPARDMRP